MNRYYLVSGDTITQAATRRNDLLARLAANGTTRVTPPNIGHARVSINGLQAIVQSEVTDAEHAVIAGITGITHLGIYDPATRRAEQAVFDWLAANAANWER